MNEIPLVQNVQKNDINTSIIAIKKQLKELNAMLGLIDVPSNDSPDMSPYVRKDEVVDVVRRFDQSPVTSNAVSESLSYSTTEQKTGGYWIDGKPIYRKVYTGLVIKNTTTLVDTLTDIDKLLSARGLITSYTSSSQTTPAYYITTDGSANGSWFIQINTSKQLRANSLHETLRITDIVIEYTKTTD